MKDTVSPSQQKINIQQVIQVKPEWLDTNGFLTKAPSYQALLNDPVFDEQRPYWPEHGAPTEFVGCYTKTVKHTLYHEQFVLHFRITPAFVEQELSTNVKATIANGSIRVTRKDAGTVIEIWEQVYLTKSGRELQWRRASVQTLVDLPVDQDNCPVKLHTFLNRFFTEAEKVFRAVGIDRDDMSVNAPANTWLFTMIRNANKRHAVADRLDPKDYWKNDLTPDWMRSIWEIAIPCFEEAKAYEDRTDYPHPEHFRSRDEWQQQTRNSIKQWFEVMDTHRAQRQHLCEQLDVTSLTPSIKEH